MFIRYEKTKSDDDQDDEQDQDDDDAEKHDVHETTQEQEDDDDHDDDENDQEDDDANDDDKKADNDDDEELTESENDGDDFVHPKLTTHDDEIIHEEDSDEDNASISSSDDEDSDDEDEGKNVDGAKTQEEATDTEDQGNEEVKDTNTDLDERDKVMTDVEDTHVTLTPVNPDGQQQSSSVSSGFVSNMLNPNQDTGVDDIFRQNTEATSFIDTNINRPPTPHPIIIQPQQQPIMTPATTTSSLLQNLPNFASLFGFDHRLKALEDNFSELKQTNQYAEALSSIPSTVDQYLAHKMQEAVDVAVQLKQLLNSDKQLQYAERLSLNSWPPLFNIYENKCRKQWTLPGPIESMTVREVVYFCKSKFLDSIDEGMKKYQGTIVKKDSLHKLPPKICSSETYNQDSRIGLPVRILARRKSASNSAQVENAMPNTDVYESTATPWMFETGVWYVTSRRRVNHLPDWFQQPTRLPSLIMHGIKYVPVRFMNLSNLGYLALWAQQTLESPTFELMKGTCKSLTELEYFCEKVYKATTEKLDWINPEGRQYPHDLRQPLPLVPNSQGRHVIPFHHFINNDLEYLRGGVSSQNKVDKIRPLGNLNWGKKRMTVLCICDINGNRSRRLIQKDGVLLSLRRLPKTLGSQDIEDMLLLLVQGKVTNLNVEERIAFNVSLRMFTRSVVIQRRVEDLQLGVESYQKKLNLTKPSHKKNRLMRIDELHKFSDGTLDDVRTALNDRLKGIRMEYLPQTFWSQRDKANARAMIQAIDKRLKTRRIMRSLERFVGGRPYGGDLRLLQRTI
ncbi:hypothetical protein Tco_0196750 [Tanacetum coccineum]